MLNTENKIKVSIIVPIYNVEKYLNKCIQTIIEQSYKNIEIILVDDGSPDNSGKICDEYALKDKRIKVIHQKNSGVSEARNAGIDIATGDYICFVDGDDYIMNDYVEYMLNLAEENNTDIALTTDMFSNFQSKQVKNDNIEVWTGKNTTVGILCYRIPIGVYCKIFKTSFLKNNNIRFLKELFIGEGFNFNTTAFQKAERVTIGHRRIYYYRRDNSTSATTKFSIEKWENGLYAIELIKKNFTINSEKIINSWKYANWRTHSDIYDIMTLASAQKTYPEMYKKCLRVIRKDAMCSLKVPTSTKERTRAMIMMICPKIIPMLMILRRKRYNIVIKK